MKIFFKKTPTVLKKPGKSSKSLGIVKLRSTRVFTKNPWKVGKRPERVKLLSQQIFLESLEGFRNVKECPKKDIGKLEKFLGKSAKFLKRLNYYPNENSDDP